VTDTYLKLTPYQQESLASWYRISRLGTAGYYAGEYSERKPTMDKLHRLGILEQPHRGGSMYWSAKVTPKGLQIALQCNEAVELTDDIEREPCGCEIDTTTGFRRVTLPCPEHAAEGRLSRG
jgi:hypothetical protein